MQQFENNHRVFVSKLWLLIEWLLLWEVSICTIYFENIQDITITEIESEIENTLNDYFTMEKLWWKKKSQNREYLQQDSEETGDGK